MRAFWMALVAGTVLVACAKGPTAGPSLPAVPSAAEPGRPSTAGLPPGAIKHIVFIVQENRTFDNIYGGPNPFPSADAVSTGQTLTGSVPLQKVALGGGTDPNNYHLEWLWA
jgi:phospholipase C